MNESKKNTSIFIGPAGWSYNDWEGIVYPPGSGHDRLLYVARYFRTIELNSSFYRLPSQRTVSSWKARLSTVPGFRLCIKVNRMFTHERQFDPSDLETFIDRFRPLSEAGISGPFLLQFPWSFRNDSPAREYLGRLAPYFRGIRAAVELRHGSWNNGAALGLLSECGFVFCNIDQPVIGDSLPPSSHVTDAGFGYIRLHGRNSGNWFRSGAGRDARYDYLYSEEEIGEWAKRAGEIIGRVGSLFIITNNHFRGQAVANALQLRSMLEGGKVKTPATLARTYDFLRPISSGPPEAGELGL
jgi:uncharacterized protein YecE (DUF72 family)